MDAYPQDYHKGLNEGARRSAEVVVPLLLDFIGPTSAVDVGAGVGSWLRALMDRGIEDICAVDGFRLASENLEIPEESYVIQDLTEPLRLDRRFDLVISLEVAEHLPPEFASTYIRSLTELGDTILFSAAIPFQGGTNHVNEQWPEYWATLFEERGFVSVDCLRRRIWNDERVEWWYAQNLFLYLERDSLEENPRLKQEHVLMGSKPLSLVHPRKYLYCIEWGMSLEAEGR